MLHILEGQGGKQYKMGLNIQTFNVRGIRDFHKRKEFFQFVKKQGVDIAILQETHSCEMDEKFWNSQWGVNVIIHMVPLGLGES